MLSIENLSKDISESLKKKLDLDEEKTSIIQYGIYAFFQMILSILLVVIIGAIFNVMIEALLISFVISIFRKYSGGVHASTSINCLIIGSIISVLPALIIRNINININYLQIIGLGIFSVAIFITYRLAPVDSINKPIRKKEKIQRLKKGSVITLIIYFILVAINILIYYYSKNEIFLIYCSCIYIGIVWQVFTLTELGHLVIRIIDSLLIKFLNRKKGS